MVAESRYEKGNVLRIFNKRTRLEKIVVVHLIESWHYQRGFTYLVYEPVEEFHLFERLDDDELKNYYDVDAVFKDVKDYEDFVKAGGGGCK